jgi:hypothetical protein
VDSIIQRFDPERKGFIKAQNIVHAMQNINPLGDALSQRDRQGLLLLTLSVTTGELIKKKKRFDAAFLAVIFDAASHAPSLDLITKGKSKMDTEGGDDGAFGDDDDDDMDEESVISDEELERRNTKMGEEVKLVRDLLKEITTPFYDEVEEVHMANNLVNSGSLSNHRGPSSPSAKAPVRSSTGDGSGAISHSFTREFPTNSCALGFIPPTFNSAGSAASLTARGLQIFEGRQGQLLVAVENVLTAHLLFRVLCLRKMKDIESEIEMDMSLEKDVLTHDGKADDLFSSSAKQPSRRVTPGMTLNTEQIMEVMGSIYAELVTLLGNDESTVILKQLTEKGSIEELERLLSELIGCPVPDGGVFGLYHSQVEVEIYLYHTRKGMADAPCHTVEEAEARKTHYQAALKEISSEIVKQLTREGKNDLLATQMNKTTKNNTSVVKFSKKGHSIIKAKDLDNSHLVKEMNGFMEKQRIESAAAYLDYLNGLCGRRKKFLTASLSLLESLKILTPGAKVTRQATPESMVALSAEEIHQRTSDLQTMIRHDLMERPSETINQMAKKVTNLKLAVKGGAVKDPNGALTSILKEINIMEDTIVQANTDLLDLTAGILAKVQKAL